MICYPCSVVHHSLQSVCDRLFSTLKYNRNIKSENQTLRKNYKKQKKNQQKEVPLTPGDEFSCDFLIENGCDLNSRSEGQLESPLHLLASSATGDESNVRLASLILSKGADANLQDLHKRTALHRAIYSNNHAIFNLLIHHPSINLDLQDSHGHPALWIALSSTPTHSCHVTVKKKTVKSEFNSNKIDQRVLETSDDDSEESDGGNEEEEEDDEAIIERHFPPASFSSQLVLNDCSLSLRSPCTGNSLLHEASLSDNQAAALFLLSWHAPCNVINHNGESVLHTSTRLNQQRLVRSLLRHGADVNLQTLPPNLNSEHSSSLPDTSPTHHLTPTAEAPQSTSYSHAIHYQTPLHLALRYKHQALIRLFLSTDGSVAPPPGAAPSEASSSHQSTQSSGKSSLNLWLKDSQNLTTFALSLLLCNLETAALLVARGAGVGDVDGEGWSLLHKALLRADHASACFLVRHGADVEKRTPEGKSCMELCIEADLPSVLQELCTNKPPSVHQPVSQASLHLLQAQAPFTTKPPPSLNPFDSEPDQSPPPPPPPPNCLLWLALSLKRFNAASVLVRHGHSVDFWHAGADDRQQTLLHHCLQANRQDCACFLIENKCDLNGARKPGLDSKEVSDGQTPLHMSACRNMLSVVKCLLSHGADVNAQDSEGNTPLHIGVTKHHDDVCSLLLNQPSINLFLSNKQHLTSFGACLKSKNHKVAMTIVTKEPSTAEQRDNQGKCLLHTSVLSRDLEAVLFLLAVKAAVDCRDNRKETPLHMAVTVAEEMIVRNLLLAGANVNATDDSKRTPLHVASATKQPLLVSILLDNQADPNIRDSGLSNCLHLACQHGHVSVVKVLVADSKMDVTAVNDKCRTALHVLAQSNKDNSALIFDLLLSSTPSFPVDAVDEEGNTALLLAYTNGNSSLCKAIVRHGAVLGTSNNNGLSLFNTPVATKQLLVKLLDLLSKEPPWSEGEQCMQCHVRFRITTRKHHCRCCGRLLCSRCSTHETPILKFQLPKPVRVCTVCFTFLTTGTLQ